MAAPGHLKTVIFTLAERMKTRHRHLMVICGIAVVAVPFLVAKYTRTKLPPQPGGDMRSVFETVVREVKVYVERTDSLPADLSKINTSHLTHVSNRGVPEDAWGHELEWGIGTTYLPEPLSGTNANHSFYAINRGTGESPSGHEPEPGIGSHSLILLSLGPDGVHGSEDDLPWQVQLPDVTPEQWRQAAGRMARQQQNARYRRIRAEP